MFVITVDVRNFLLKPVDLELQIDNSFHFRKFLAEETLYCGYFLIWLLLVQTKNLLLSQVNSHILIQYLRCNFDTIVFNLNHVKFTIF